MSKNIFLNRRNQYIYPYLSHTKYLENKWYTMNGRFGEEKIPLLTHLFVTFWMYFTLFNQFHILSNDRISLTTYHKLILMRETEKNSTRTSLHQKWKWKVSDFFLSRICNCVEKSLWIYANKLQIFFFHTKYRKRA